MDDKMMDEILKCLVFGCYMLTDECNPVLVDGNKTEADVKAWQERAMHKFQGRVRGDDIRDNNLFHSVVTKMFHSIVDITTKDEVNDV